MLTHACSQFNIPLKFLLSERQLIIVNVLGELSIIGGGGGGGSLSPC